MCPNPTSSGQPCIGYGEHEGRCENPPDLDLNEAGLWCTRCELLRRATITQQMAEITARFEEPS